LDNQRAIKELSSITRAKKIPADCHILVFHKRLATTDEDRRIEQGVMSGTGKLLAKL
jgi:hypothetical protein